MEKYQHFNSVKFVESHLVPRRLARIMIISLLLLLIVLFLPWTQTVRSTGNVTAFNPSNRPQTVHAIIGGRIEKWFVQEGDFVKKGDTLVFLTEVKPEYMDPKLIARTESQIKSKEGSVDSYMEKIRALDNQIDALNDNRLIKLKQCENKIRQGRLKIKTDSMDYRANSKQLDIAIKQYERTEALVKERLKSTTDLENKRLKVQEMEAKVVSLENKLLTSRNELLNAIAELNAIDSDYRDKIAKSEADKASSLSQLYDTEATVTKMQNEVSNYTIRSGYYYVTAPQDGFISQALKSGVGETIKEGTPILSIVPTLSDYAVELFVSPMDLPLLHAGEKVRIQFDGWPAIIFSGWPNVSHGTYGGIIMAIDNHVNEQGKYRLLLKPDTSDYTWPKGLRMGVAVNGFALLNDVPIWYEFWRKINGFPPDYYTRDNLKKTDKKKK
jgi:adhesin transport system membrane fusion protein